MPIYEYGCKACGHEFEEWQKITDEPITKCPACGKRKVEKLVSRSSFHLKGGGWYADLYGSSSRSNGKSGSSATKPSGSSTSKASEPSAKSAASSSTAASSTASSSTASTAGSKS